MQIVAKTNKIEFSNLLDIENVLIASFEDFKNENPVATIESFKELLEQTNLQYVFDKHPAAENILAQYQKKDNIKTLVHQKYTADTKLIHQHIFKSQDEKDITHVHTGAGDYHKGLSTAIVNLGEVKLVFKPTSAGVSEAFFAFLDWVQPHNDLGNFRYEIIAKDNYHWLSFVNQQDCKSLDEVKLYYERAGFMLGVLYILNACDFHYENVIAQGSTPVFIDHETVIQPKINQDFQKLFKNFLNKEIEDSVIQTMLLPNHHDQVQSMPIGTCGYGYHKQKNMQTLKKEAVDRYTDNWRFVTRFGEESFQKENLPTLNGVAVYPISHLDELLTGFEKCYALFLKHKTFMLTDKQSPILAFENKTIRFIWRATNVYAKILNQMKLPKNLGSHEHYEQKIKDYLFVAFKNVPKDSDLLKIHQHEVAHMLKGDVPFFEVSTSSRDLETDFGIIKDFFELDAIENAQRKLNKLSEEDLAYQKELIRKSILA